MSGGRATLHTERGIAQRGVGPLAQANAWHVLRYCAGPFGNDQSNKAGGRR